MSVTDFLLALLRWLHALAAVAWVGGSIFFFAVLRPALRREGRSEVEREVAREFRSLVDTAVVVLLLTGAILTLSRLTSGVPGALYLGLLGLKIALALWLFLLVWWRRRPPGRPRQGAWARLAGILTGANLFVILGVLVLLLADLLKVVFERGLLSR